MIRFKNYLMSIQMYSARMNNTTLHYVAQDKIVKVIFQTPAKKHLIAESIFFPFFVG